MNYIEEQIKNLKDKYFCHDECAGLVGMNWGEIATFLLTSLNGMVEEIKKGLPSRIIEVDYSSKPGLSHSYGVGQKDKLFEITEYLDQMKFNPKRR